MGVKMDVNPSQHPIFYKESDFSTCDNQNSAAIERISKVNNDLEDLMEKFEDFLSKTDQYPEVHIPVKELKNKAAQLRKAQPENFDPKAVDNYTTEAAQLQNEVQDRWDQLNKQLIDAKIAGIKTEVFRENGNKFIASLSKMKEEFVLANYRSVVDYYQRNIDRFKELAASLTPQNFEENKIEWLKQHEKFIPNHEQLLKLKDTNKVMQFFIKIADEVLKNNIRAGEDPASLHQKLKSIAEFLDENPEPKQLEEIEEYIKEVENFLKKLEVDF